MVLNLNLLKSKKGFKMVSLFTPLNFGGMHLPNRVLMAPLTRNRAYDDGTPGHQAARYYAQRASAGLIISEATQISAMGKGYINTPGIYTKNHIKVWKHITDSVHASGGRLFVQLWHVGRISHCSLLPKSCAPLAPSAIRANAKTFSKKGEVAVSTPVAMTLDDIQNTLNDYEHAAHCALEAGFDGVEIHGANGYLIDQFLQSTSNKRVDDYGGSLKNRMRFLHDVIKRVLNLWPKERVGVRLSPMGTFNDMADEEPDKTFPEAIRLLNTLGLGYLHLVEGCKARTENTNENNLLKACRESWEGVYFANGGYAQEDAVHAVKTGHAHAITFGIPFISNPDLPRRLFLNRSLSQADPNRFYGGNEKGYTDYPFMSDDLF